jgi:uncharacterized protein
MNRVWVVSTVLLFVLVLALAGSVIMLRQEGAAPGGQPPTIAAAVKSAVAADTPTPSSITVSGVGTAKAIPDVAYITAGVESSKATANDAQKETANKANAIIDKLKSLGVAEKDLRTSGLSLSPVYGPNSQVITGYRASNEVRVTVQDINKTGELMDAAVSVGANRGGQITLGFKDDSKMRLDALADAVKSAEGKANAIAKASGASIVGVDSIVEDSGSQARPAEFVARAAIADAAAPSPVMPGELTISATVRVVYRFR